MRDRTYLKKDSDNDKAINFYTVCNVSQNP